MTNNSTKLASARKNAGMSRKKAAELIGCSEYMLNKFEKGEEVPSRYLLNNMANTYGVSYSILI